MRFLLLRGPRARAAVRGALRRDRGDRHGHGGLDDRHRLLRHRRTARLSSGLQLRRLYHALVDTAALSGAILLIIGTATAMAWALTQSGFSRQLALCDERSSRRRGHVPGRFDHRLRRVGQRAGRDPGYRPLRTAPVPIARQVGINEVHYAIVVVLAMGLGLFAPPFGVGYYAACAISQVDPGEGLRAIWGYLLALLVGLIVVAAVPWISTGFL